MVLGLIVISRIKYLINMPNLVQEKLPKDMDQVWDWQSPK